MGRLLGFGCRNFAKRRKIGIWNFIPKLMSWWFIFKPTKAVWLYESLISLPWVCWTLVAYSSLQHKYVDTSRASLRFLCKRSNFMKHLNALTFLKVSLTRACLLINYFHVVWISLYCPIFVFFFFSWDEPTSLSCQLLEFLAALRLSFEKFMVYRFEDEILC